MKMIMRWFTSGDDSVTLEQIKQVPGVTGVATMLPDIPRVKFGPWIGWKHYVSRYRRLDSN